MTRPTRFPRRRKSRRMNVREGGPLRCPAHLQWIRGHECAAKNFACSGVIEAAHVRMGMAGGMGVKPGDDRAIPLCSFHHRLQHDMGEKRFWGDIDPFKIIERLNAQSPPLRKLRMKERDDT